MVSMHSPEGSVSTMHICEKLERRKFHRREKLHLKHKLMALKNSTVIFLSKRLGKKVYISKQYTHY